MENFSQIAGASLPEVFYGQNRFYAAFPDGNLLIEFCPIETISFSSYEKREKFMRT